MMKIKVILPNEQSEEKEFEAGTTPEKVLTTLSEKPLHQIYACKLDNYYERLNTPMTKDGTLSFCDISNSYGNMAMQGSLILLYCAAVHEVVGKSVKITIANSLSKGLFTIIHDGSVNEDCIHKIEKKMSEMVREDLPIGETVMNRRDTMAWLKAHNMKDEMDLYESAPDLREALVCTLKEEEDLQYYHTVPSTGYLKLFELRKYRNGILLRFPHPEHPDEVSAFEEQKLLYDAFSEETHWENLCGVNFASDLNHCVENNSYKDLIQISEALHEKKIAEIADKIRTSHKRIILIAGPSSSGKTSFAKRLCIQLQVIGLKPLYLGTDDYFVNREDMIVGPDGKKDLEGLSAVDVRLFTSQMNDLLAGKKVDLPTFDFIKGEKIYGKRITSIDPSQPIVIEGIHVPVVPEAKENHRYAIFISARNEQGVVYELLDSLMAQDYPKDRYDVYLVADNCTDNTAGVAREHGYPRFNGPQAFGDAMVGYGFNLVSLANNHSLDMDQVGVENSLAYWKSKTNVVTSGVYESQAEREAIPVHEVNGIKYAFFSWTYGMNGLEPPAGKEYQVACYDGYEDEMVNQIKAAKQKADVVIVAMHWGTEYVLEATEEQQRVAQEVADAGADIIIGNHPHVIGPVQWLNDHKTICFYALGNLVAAQFDDSRIEMMAALNIEKTTFEGKSTIQIKDVKTDLMYCYGTKDLSYYETVPFSQMSDDTYVANHAAVYEEYKPYVTALDPTIQVGGF